MIFGHKHVSRPGITTNLKCAMGQVTTVPQAPHLPMLVGYRHTQPPLTFYTGAGDLNSVLLPAQQMILPAKPCPHPAVGI